MLNDAYNSSRCYAEFGKRGGGIGVATGRATDWRADGAGLFARPPSDVGASSCL